MERRAILVSDLREAKFEELAKKLSRFCGGIEQAKAKIQELMSNNPNITRKELFHAISNGNGHNKQKNDFNPRTMYDNGKRGIRPKRSRRYN